MIALPFQGKAAKNGHTLFLNPETGFLNPYEDQWTTLSGVKKINEAALDEIINMWSLKQEKAPATIYNGLNGNKEVVERLLECSFISWCKDNPAKVSEPLWYAMISNLIRMKGGYSFAHELSRPYPNYTKEETDKKIHQAMDKTDPMTCSYIKTNGFKCRKFCAVKAPVGLIYAQRKNNETEGPLEWREDKAEAA